MKSKLNISTIVAMVASAIISIYAPAAFFFMLLLYSNVLYSIFPFLVLLGFGVIVYSSIKKIKKLPVVVLIFGMPLLSLSILGQLIDFTPEDSSGPGVWEWINLVSPYTTFLVLLLSMLRHWKLDK